MASPSYDAPAVQLILVGNHIITKAAGFLITFAGRQIHNSKLITKPVEQSKGIFVAHRAKECYNTIGDDTMTLKEYRIRHSMLIEQYQWIEFDLEGLYAAISAEPFCEALREIEKDSIGGVVREIKKIENEKNIVIFSDEEYQELDMLRERRNFWCHACYTGAYDKITGVPQNEQMLLSDLRKAETFLERVRKIKDMHLEKNRERIISSLFSK